MSTPEREAPGRGGIKAYIQIARIDHWFKNVFMALGVILAVFFRPELFTLDSAVTVAVSVAITCIIASSNYVLNETLDAPLDRLHPTKRHRKYFLARVARFGHHIPD